MLQQRQTRSLTQQRAGRTLVCAVENKPVGASLWHTRAVTSRKQGTPTSALFKKRHLPDLRDDRALRLHKIAVQYAQPGTLCQCEVLRRQFVHRRQAPRIAYVYGMFVCAVRWFAGDASESRERAT